MGVQDNIIGKRLAGQECVGLQKANPECDTCAWLESGYQTADSLAGIESYATEILLHRRMLHLCVESPN